MKQLISLAIIFSIRGIEQVQCIVLNKCSRFVIILPIAAIVLCIMVINKRLTECTEMNQSSDTESIILSPFSATDTMYNLLSYSNKSKCHKS